MQKTPTLTKPTPRGIDERKASASIHGEKSGGAKARGPGTTSRCVGVGSHCLSRVVNSSWRAKRTNDASECNGQEEDDKRQATTASERE
jgi:hypothetical protein